MSATRIPVLFALVIGLVGCDSPPADPTPNAKSVAAAEPVADATPAPTPGPDAEPAALPSEPNSPDAENPDQPSNAEVCAHVHAVLSPGLKASGAPPDQLAAMAANCVEKLDAQLEAIGAEKHYAQGVCAMAATTVEQLQVCDALVNPPPPTGPPGPTEGLPTPP